MEPRADLVESLRAGDMEGLAASVSEAMLGLMRDLFPICRSITGPGLRSTIERISRIVPIEVTEVPSGTRIFDWTVPAEWEISEAYVEDADGRRVLDFRDHNLHVVNYSIPIDAEMTLDELRSHLHTLPDDAGAIPFRTSYYTPSWGFCLAENAAKSLQPGKYRAVIRSRLEPGSLTIGEHLHRGRSSEEVLIFTHCCHPSLVNDNLSGIAVAAYLAAYLRGRSTRYTYRFVFAPATIGSIAWLATNESRLGSIRHGLVLAMLGDCKPLRYKPSRGGDAEIDKALRLLLRDVFPDGAEVPYSPWGFDERQFATPGISLPVGRLTRALPGELREEHTSRDNFEIVSKEALGKSLEACLRVVDVLERNRTFLNLHPKGEPQLGRRGLFRATGGHYDSVPERQIAMLWMLDQSDGTQSVLDIALRSGLPFDLLAHVAAELVEVDLLGTIG